MDEPARELLADQYADVSNIRIRRRFHKRFGRRETKREEWVFERLSAPEGGCLLDVGCGEGRIWQRNARHLPSNAELVLLDFSAGILADAAPEFDSIPGIDLAFVAGDAQELPLVADAFDGVLAMQMLHHVRSRPEAYAEFERVLTDGGRVYVTASSRENCQELYDLMDEVATGSVTPPPKADPDEFSLEMAGDELHEHFGQVETHVFENELVIDDPDGIVAWALSHRGFDGFALHPEEADDLHALAETRLSDGPITASVSYGLFIAEV